MATSLGLDDEIHLHGSFLSQVRQVTTEFSNQRVAIPIGFDLAGEEEHHLWLLERRNQMTIDTNNMNFAEHQNVSSIKINPCVIISAIVGVSSAIFALYRLS